MGTNKYDAADIDQIRNYFQCLWLLKCHHDLKRVKDRKQWQEDALTLTKQYIRLLLILSAIYWVAVVFLMITIMGPEFYGGEPHPGHVRKGQIEYIDNVEQYVSLSKLGVEAKEGESVTVYTDNVGTPIACVARTEGARQAVKSVVIFMSIIAYAILSIFVAHGFAQRSLYYASFKIFVYEYLKSK